MSSLIVAGDISGAITLQAPTVAGSTILNLPAVTGNIAVVTTGNVIPVNATNTQVSSSTVTPDVNSYSQYNFTALAANLTINSPTGTVYDGQKLTFRLLDNGVARGLTWNANYVVIGTTLPTITTANKISYVGCVYNSTSTKWDVVAVTTQV